MTTILPPSKTLKALKESSAYNRFPYSGIAYANRKEILSEDLHPMKLKVAIVGGGLSGMALSYKLSEIANQARLSGKKASIHVDLFENHPEHFLNQTKIKAPSATVRAGRLSSITSSEGIVYEEGAMRIPDKSGLVWHLLSKLYPEDTELSAFPSANWAPIQIAWGNQIDERYGARWTNDQSPAKEVSTLVTRELMHNTTYFAAAGYTLAQISQLSKEEGTSSETIEAIKEDLAKCRREVGHQSLSKIIRQIIQDNIDTLPEIEGILNAKEKIDQYLHLYAIVGFGAGHIGAFMESSWGEELLKDLFWDYTNVYTFPERSVDVVIKLHKKILSTSSVSFQFRHIYGEAVQAFNIKTQGSIQSAGLIWHSAESTVLETSYYDHIILAIPSRAAAKLVDPTNNPTKLDDLNQSVHPALLLATLEENEKVLQALQKMHMVPTTKLFIPIHEEDLALLPPLSQPNDGVRIFVSDTSLMNCFFRRAANGKLFMLSLAWEEAAQKQQAYLEQVAQPPNNSEECAKIVAKGILQELKEKQDILYPFFKRVCEYSSAGFHFFNWTQVEGLEGGFRTYLATDHPYHEILNQFCLDNLGRVLLLGCCYGSNAPGGWMESSLMSIEESIEKILGNIPRKSMLNNPSSFFGSSIQSLAAGETKEHNASPRSNLKTITFK